MSRCPSCDFLVQVEWSACRRCGAPLPLDLREPHGTSPRLPALPARRAPATGESLPTLPPPSDTLLPRGAQHASAPPTPVPREARADTFLPRETPAGGRLGHRAVTPATALDTLVDIGRRVLHLWRPT